MSSSTEDLLASVWLKQVTEKTSDSIMRSLSDSLSSVSCEAEATVKGCRDESSALVLKIVAIVTILCAGVCGVAIPLVGKNRRYLQTDSNLFVVAKAFAAGVILATGFVHMLPDATEALTNPCLPEVPWSKFPFPGFIAMMAALATLLAEFVWTQYYEHKHESQSQSFQVASVDEESSSETGVGKVFGEEEGGAMHIVGMHAHAAHHRHSYAQENGVCQGQLTEHEHNHSHFRGLADGDEEEGSVRHIVVSQVLELGIVSHSVIIGLSLGVSQSPCTIRTLIVALSFHQFFEGFALGGCVSQAKFSALKSTLMAVLFTITTPSGVAVGSSVSNFYNRSSPRALVIEGILDSVSSGILIYMSLVDLIAADFLSKRMRCNARLQVMSYLALFLGAGLMASLAAWDA